MKTPIDVPPREEWLKIKKYHIGASEAPVIMNGKHFKRTVYDLWKEKVDVGSVQTDNYAMRRGRIEEEAARQLYEKKTGVLMFPKMVFHETIKFMMTTLDGLSMKWDMSVEIKCPGLSDHKTALQGKVPEKYYAQLQHQLACTGHQTMHYFSYQGKELGKNGEVIAEEEGVLIKVDRDEAYIKRLYIKEAEFWNSVLILKAPDMLDEDYTETKCELWKNKTEGYQAREKLFKEMEKEKKEDKVWFIKECNGQSTRGFGLSVRRVTSKGLVNYKAVPQLEGVDLDIYRGSSRESWTIRT